MIRLFDMFSGIGAFTLGLQRAGATSVAFCENDQFCRDILRRHWPGVPILEDVHDAEFPQADVICGGFPCQDVSRAGRRSGLAGANSGLFWELVRAIRLVRPKVAIVENVAALLDDGMGAVLGEMAASGFDTEWDCVPACALGACHERDRVWIVAHTNGERSEGGESTSSTASLRRRSSDTSDEGAAYHAADTNSDRGPQSEGIEPEKRQWTGDSSEARLFTDTPGYGCGQGWPGGPPDSFARIRDEARRNAADPYGARLAFREGLGRDAWEELTAAQRSRGEDVGQSIWPDEPALSGVDDEVADWAHRTKATGNTLDPLIPELIGLAVFERSFPA